MQSCPEIPYIDEMNANDTVMVNNHVEGMQAYAICKEWNTCLINYILEK